MQEGIKSGKQIMEARLLQERKDELEKNLKKDKRYSVCITSVFQGKFSRFEEWNGEEYVVFEQAGLTDRGTSAVRRVKVSQIMSTKPLP